MMRSIVYPNDMKVEYLRTTYLSIGLLMVEKSTSIQENATESELQYDGEKLLAGGKLC